MSDVTAHPSSRTGRVLVRSILAGLCAATMAIALASPAVAGQPTPPSCLGQDIRALAEMGPNFGAFVSGVLADEGAGTEVQSHQAGQIPGTTCHS